MKIKGQSRTRAYKTQYMREYRAGVRSCVDLIGSICKHKDLATPYARKLRGMPEPTRPCPATCECCDRPPGVRALALDHCHVTGAFRGWLCFACNSAIGRLGDNAAGIQRALDYIKRSVSE